jgi:murein DD-endopeptidase MepM/ murein hydrolase activator NlpD
MEIIVISKQRNLLKNLRLPFVVLRVMAGVLIVLTLSTIMLGINLTRRTFVKMHLTKSERESATLMTKLDDIHSSLKQAQAIFDQHVAQDNRERTYWQMAHIHPDIWSMGIGGKQTTLSPYIVDRRIVCALGEIHESIDVLKGKYYLRQSSLREIKEQIEDNLYLWSHIPSIHPVPGHDICSGFGYRVDPIDRKIRLHTGFDIGAPRGTKILATADGIINFAGWVNGYGWTVVIDHGFGFVTAYAHCQRILVNEQEFVTRGQEIAQVGSTGRSISPHLHYEVRVSGMKIDPHKYIDTSSIIFD